MTCVMSKMVSTFFLLYVQTNTPAYLGEYYSLQDCERAQKQVIVKTICAASGTLREELYHSDNCYS